MTQLTIYGSSASTFVRAVRMAAEEKGVAYELVSHAPWEPQAEAPHPFKRIPTMRHGDFVLSESQAIVRYIDRAFPGPALMPADLRGAAIADQWISAVCDYCAASMNRGLSAPRLLYPRIGRSVDEAAVQANLPVLASHLDILESTLARSAFLAGERLTLADLFLAPMLCYVGVTAEGQAALAGRAAIGRWYADMAGRPSFTQTKPELPPERKAA